MEVEGYKHISNVSKIALERINKIRNGELVPILTSSKKENEKLGGMYSGEKIVIAARTGVGKTAYVIDRIDDYTNWQINPHWENKVIILFDSLEMADWRLVLRMISKQEQNTVQSLIDYNNKMSQERFNIVNAISEKFASKPIYISNVSNGIPKWKADKLAKSQKYPNHQIINILDHTRLITKTNERSEEELITSLMNAAIDISNQTGQIFIFLSQMNRNIESNSGDRSKIGLNTPIASDIFGSDGLYQGADTVIALHRPGMYNLEEFQGVQTGYNASYPDADDYLMVECILKQRDGWVGNLLMEHNLAHNKIFDYDNTIIR